MTRPAPLRPLEQLSAASTLTPTNQVRLRPGLRFTIRAAGEHLVIDLPDKEVRLDTAAADAVRVATSGRPVAADTLPGIDVHEGLTLLSQLLRDGIVVPA